MSSGKISSGNARLSANMDLSLEIGESACEDKVDGLIPCGVRTTYLLLSTFEKLELRSMPHFSQVAPPLLHLPISPKQPEQVLCGLANCR